METEKKPGRPGLTKDDVLNAITRLRERNIQPTVENIHLEIGQGSYTTINRFLRQIKQVAEGSWAQQTMVEEIPDEIKTHLWDMKKVFLNKAQKIINEMDAAIKEKNVSIDSYLKRIEELETKCQFHAKDLDFADSKIELLSKENLAVKDKIKLLQEKNEQLLERACKAEAQVEAKDYLIGLRPKATKENSREIGS